MSEKQEMVWVVMRFGNNLPGSSDPVPTKVFDDRQDARDYVKTWNERSKKFKWKYTGVKKG